MGQVFDAAFERRFQDQEDTDPLIEHLDRDDKEQIARAFAAKRGITEGDVCALSTMEMAPTFQHDKTDMGIRPRPCLAIYHYRMDPEFGWMHARIQTWVSPGLRMWREPSNCSRNNSR